MADIDEEGSVGNVDNVNRHQRAARGESRVRTLRRAATHDAHACDDSRGGAPGHKAAARGEGPRQTAARADGACGVTLVELLVALVVVLVVSAGLMRLAQEARAFFTAQPEAVDVTHRARVGVDLLLAELTNAGAGPSLGEDAGPLARWFPVLLPFRYQGAGSGVGSSDPPGSVFGDRLTIITAVDDVPLVRVQGDMTAAGDPIPFVWQPGCPTGDPACGFTDDQRIAVFDRSSAFELATVRGTWPGQIQHDPALLAKPYRQTDDARVVRVRAVTYYHDVSRRQVRRSTGPRADGPVVDQVAALSFRYFGDRAPPRQPRPPTGSASTGSASAASANCLFDESGVSRLPVLSSPADGDQVELTMAMLSDGPFCGMGAGQFDADLYRVRRVRVTLRVQAAAPVVRGRDPLLFRNPGSATDPRLLVPDFTVVFDVAPRNLQG